MVKEILFDVERKTHCVPWKYGRCFVFVFVLFRLHFLVQAEYQILIDGKELNTLMNTLNSALRIRSYLSSTYGMQIMCIEKWSLNNGFMAQNDIHMNP